MHTAIQSQPLPAYISQKRVYALHIARVEKLPIADITPGQSWQLVPTDERYPPVRVSSEWIDKHQPQAGGYWVRYPDKYESFAPRDAFEAGNMPKQSYGPPYHQETKYTIGERGRITNRYSSEPVPDDEPLMIFRAKDQHAAAAIEAYMQLVQDAEHAASVQERLTAFQRFAAEHPERMREPSST